MEDEQFQTSVDVSDLKSIRIVENDQLDIGPLIGEDFIIADVILVIKKYFSFVFSR